MKQKLLSALAAVAALMMAGTANGQSKFMLSFTEGLNFSQLIGIDNTTVKPGVHSGLDVSYFFNDNWGITAGFNYSEQGTRCKETPLIKMMDYNYSYVNFPILANYRLPKYNLSFMGGLQLGSFVGASYDYYTPSIPNPDEYVEGSGRFDGDSFHSWDCGLTLATRWMFLPRWGIGLEARYTLGLTQTHNGISTTSEDNIYISVPDNRNSTLLVAFVFVW